MEMKCLGPKAARTQEIYFPGMTIMSGGGVRFDRDEWGFIIVWKAERLHNVFKLNQNLAFKALMN